MYECMSANVLKQRTKIKSRITNLTEKWQSTYEHLEIDKYICTYKYVNVLAISVSMTHIYILKSLHLYKVSKCKATNEQIVITIRMRVRANVCVFGTYK